MSGMSASLAQIDRQFDRSFAQLERAHQARILDVLIQLKELKLAALHPSPCSPADVRRRLEQLHEALRRGQEVARTRLEVLDQAEEALLKATGEVRVSPSSGGCGPPGSASPAAAPPRGRARASGPHLRCGTESSSASASPGSGCSGGSPPRCNFLSKPSAAAAAALGGAAAESGAGQLGWSSGQDTACFLREVRRADKRKKQKTTREPDAPDALSRYFDFHKVWTETSAAVGSVDDVKDYLQQWLKEQERRKREKEAIQQWKRQRKQQQKVCNSKALLCHYEEAKPPNEDKHSKEHQKVIKAKLEEWKHLKKLEQSIIKTDTVLDWAAKRSSQESKRKALKKPAALVHKAVDQAEEEQPPRFQSSAKLLASYQRAALDHGRQLRGKLLSQVEVSPVEKRSCSVPDLLREPERLFQQTQCSRARYSKQRPLNSGQSGQLIEHVAKLAVPEWRRSLVTVLS